MALKTFYIFTFLLGLISAVPASGQDLMARQAPVDRSLRAIDSITLHRALKQETSEMVSNLYSSWSNEHVNMYKDVEKPNTFRIDMMGYSMPTTSRMITSRYGYRRAFRRNHYGLDVKVYTGDTIYAAFQGKARIVSYDRNGYGYYIVLRHPNGLETVYGHLSKQLVHENDVVRSGEPIGLGGSTGHSTGSHLHFETRLLGETIDPELLFDFPNQDVTCDAFVYHSNASKEKAEAFAKSLNDSTTIATEVVANGSAEKVVEYTSQEQTATDKSGKRSKSVYHKVRKGDNLYNIAKKNHLTVDQLCALNGLNKKSSLRPGQILKCK